MPWLPDGEGDGQDERQMTVRRIPTLVALTAVLLTAVQSFRTDLGAFSANGPTWHLPAVPYVLNPANLDLPEAQAESAMLVGASSWATQASPSFSFTYAGRSTQTTTTLDGLNLVVFRNAGNGAAIATTYYWFNGSGFLDADIVFWDGGFRFFAGSSGCSGGFYIEDIAAHEFGHALGLGHTDVAGATMFPSASSCSTALRSLEADDIAGVQSLYPPTALPPGPPTGLRIKTD